MLNLLYPYKPATWHAFDISAQSHIDTLSNTLHHHTKLKLSRCFGGTNTANRVHANGFPANNLSASSSSSYLHLCRTPTFPWSRIFGDAMQNRFWIRRGSSLKGIGGIWALVTNVQGLTMHLRVVHVCWIQVQGMIRWFYIWNNGCNRRLVHSAWCTAEANTTETNTAHFVEYNASHGWISTVPVPPYIWNVYTTWLTLSMYTCDSCAISTLS